MTRDPVFGNPTELTPSQAQAADPNWASQHPAEAARNHYYGSFSTPMGYDLGKNFRRVMARPNAIGDVLNSGPQNSALAGGGIGAVLGGLAGKFTGGSVTTDALLGSLLGAGLGAYSGYSRQPKQASYSGSFPLVAQSVQSSAALDALTKQQVMAALPRLDSNQLDQLADIVKQYGGFAAGAIIARFMLHAGLLGTLAGGLIGGMFGNALTQSPRHDALGFNSLQ